MPSASSTATRWPTATPSRIAAVVAGNALEFYDFLTYGFFAAQIGRALFPGSSASDSLLWSLATFGAGFLTRPLGGLAIGAIADRKGRRPAMLLSFMLMGVAIVGLALTPSYSLIGGYAGALAVGFRMIQGFALGGELGPSTAYLMEAAPAHRRGLYVSFQFASQNAAILAAGLVGLVLSSQLSAAALQGWGWRLAMLLGALTVPFGWLLRRRLEETLTPSLGPILERSAVSYLGLAVVGVLLFGASTISVYTLNYLTTYAQTTLHMNAQVAFAATVVLGLTSCVFAVVSGLLSDRFGRRPVALAALAVLLLATGPAFMLMLQSRTAGMLFIATGGLAVLAALGNGAMMVMVTESVPAHLRARSLGVTYAVAICLFGGSAQLTVAWLIRVTGDPLAPAWYMSTAVAVALVTTMFVRETAPGHTAARPVRGADAVTERR